MVSSVCHALLENDLHVANNSSGMETSKTNLKDKLHHLFSRKSFQLEEENRRLKEERMCKICTDKEISIVVIPVDTSLVVIIPLYLFHVVSLLFQHVKF